MAKIPKFWKRKEASLEPVEPVIQPPVEPVKKLEPYQANPDKTKNNRKIVKSIRSMRRRSYLTSLIISQDKQRRATVMEKIIKFIIYAALRLVIPPKRWKDPKKNYLLIDKAYERIISADFIYIPSSLAFYIIMAFMPVCAVILLVSSLKAFEPVLQINGESALAYVLGGFVPGVKDVLQQFSDVTKILPSAELAGAYTSIIIGLVVSTWIAAGGFAKLVFTQSHMYGHKYVGGYWMNKLKGMSMVVGFTLYLLIVLIVNVAIVKVINASPVLTTETQKTAVRYIFLFFSLGFFVFIGFGGLYRYSPRFKTRWRWILPGTMTTTLPTVGFLVLIGPITSRWSYSNFGYISVMMYIAMTSLIITYFVFVGITVNAAYHHAFVGKIDKKWTLSKK